MPNRIKATRLAYAAYGLALLIVVADQLSKYWIVAVYGLEAKQTTPILPFLSLTWVENRGVSFGLFQSPSGEETIRTRPRSRRVDMMTGEAALSLP